MITCPDELGMWDLDSDVPRSRNQTPIMIGASDNETFAIDPRWNIRRIEIERNFIWRQELKYPNESVSKRKMMKILKKLTEEYGYNRSQSPL